MRKRKFLAAMLAAAVMVTTVTDTMVPASVAKAAEPVETTIEKTKVSNPILGKDNNGDVLYGGDPSVLVDGDTLYLYTGRDTSTKEAYFMPEWQCYSTKDLKTWQFEDTIMTADKQSITWANTGTDAWAGQIEKYNGKYYFYYCTWDATSQGKQSIGVAVADNPTGPYKDIGHPLVKGTLTTGQSSDWNDIDPTVWVETDEYGEEHRYLSWGNGKLFVCELNEDMISVKDINGDGAITFGTQASGASSETADIIELNVPGGTFNFTEAPWIYRRKDESGNPVGPYYLFYAYGWREQMAYATTDNLMDGQMKFGSILMPPTATSNTNHMAVFDFQGKTYFIYHNGSLPGGSGFRRTACITELHFNDDGSVKPIPETAIGITGDKPYYLFTNAGHVISHENFVNSSADGAYPYKDIGVGTYYQPEKLDASWAIVDGKADPDKDSYVSIQSENKPGLYLTVGEDDRVLLSQDAKYSVVGGKIKVDEACAKAQTFRTVKGLTDSAKAISFESVAKPGSYLCMDNGSLVVRALADCDVSADFYLNTPPTFGSTDPGNPGTANDITSLKINDAEVTKSGYTYEYEVPSASEAVALSVATQDAQGFVTMDGKLVDASRKITVPLKGIYTRISLCVYSADRKPRVTYTVVIKKNYSAGDITSPLFKGFDFEEQTDGAAAVTKAAKPVAVANPQYQYTDGAKGGKAIYLPGTYGLKLCDAAGIGKNYSVSYWMKPEKLGGDVDPTLAAGTFSPEYWLNLTFGRSIWSRANGNFVDDAGTITYEKDKWQLVTLTVNDNKAKLYVNGELKGNGSIASNIMGQTDAAIYFGVNAWDAYFNGSLDDVKIYNDTLSETEVMAIAASVVEKPAELPQPDPNAPTGSGIFSDGDIEKPEPEKPDPEKPDPEKPGPTNPGTQNPAPKPTIKRVTVKAANQKAGVKTVYLKKGGKVTLTATVTGTGKFSKAVEWSSSKKSIATVSGKGLVKAKTAGTAKITVKSKANKSKKATITVKVLKKAVKNTKLKLKASKKTLKVGKTYTVAIKSITSKTTDAVTYKSSKSSIASVDKYGVVKAKKKGKATITVKCGKKSAKLAITVKK